MEAYKTPSKDITCVVDLSRESEDLRQNSGLSCNLCDLVTNQKTDKLEEVKTTKRVNLKVDYNKMKSRVDRQNNAINITISQSEYTRLQEQGRLILDDIYIRDKNMYQRVVGR